MKPGRHASRGGAEEGGDGGAGDRSGAGADTVTVAAAGSPKLHRHSRPARTGAALIWVAMRATYRTRSELWS